MVTLCNTLTNHLGPRESLNKGMVENHVRELGMFQVYSKAYHYQANGRTERAGHQIMEKLRKLHLEVKVNWVESIPARVDRIHDTPGETGLSPYQIYSVRIDQWHANISPTLEV